MLLYGFVMVYVDTTMLLYVSQSVLCSIRTMHYSMSVLCPMMTMHYIMSVYCSMPLLCPTKVFFLF